MNNGMKNIINAETRQPLKSHKWNLPSHCVDQ